MDPTTLTIVWIVIVGVVVGLLAWFGPRPSQWRGHEHVEDPTDPDHDDSGERDDSGELEHRN